MKMTIKKLLINYSEQTAKTILDWQNEVGTARNLDENYFFNYQGKLCPGVQRLRINSSNVYVDYAQFLLLKDKRNHDLGMYGVSETQNPIPKEIKKPTSKDIFELQNKAVQDLELFFKADSITFSDPKSNGDYWLYQDAVYLFEGLNTNDEKKLLIMEFVDRECKRFEHLNNKFSGKPTQRVQYDRFRIPENVRVDVWRRDQGKCVRCGSRINLEYDHIVPISKGGSNTARNIELLCQNCNREKGNKI